MHTVVACTASSPPRVLLLSSLPKLLLVSVSSTSVVMPNICGTPLMRLLVSIAFVPVVQGKVAGELENDKARFSSSSTRKELLKTAWWFDPYNQERVKNPDVVDPELVHDLQCSGCGIIADKLREALPKTLLSEFREMGDSARLDQVRAALQKGCDKFTTFQLGFEGVQSNRRFFDFDAASTAGELRQMTNGKTKPEFGANAHRLCKALVKEEADILVRRMVAKASSKKRRIVDVFSKQTFCYKYLPACLDDDDELTVSPEKAERQEQTLNKRRNQAQDEIERAKNNMLSSESASKEMMAGQSKDEM